MIQECQTCFFWRERQCRRNPPAANGPSELGGKPGYLSYWPKTEQDDWCGEWRPQQKMSSGNDTIGELSAWA